MKLFIPEIGTKLTLTKRWTFNLHHEYRNDMAGVELGLADLGVHGTYSWKIGKWHANPGPDVVALPAKTVLTVNRIYIRQGAEDYSSITFWAKIPGMKKKIRFWAKLSDVNNIHYKLE